MELFQSNPKLCLTLETNIYNSFIYLTVTVLFYTNVNNLFKSHTHTHLFTIAVITHFYLTPKSQFVACVGVSLNVHSFFSIKLFPVPASALQLV